MQAKWNPSLLTVFRLRCNNLTCPGCFPFRIDQARTHLHTIIDRDYAAGRPWHLFTESLTDAQIDAVDAKLRRRRKKVSDRLAFQRESIQQAGGRSTTFTNAPLKASRSLPATVPIPTVEEAKAAVDAALATAVAVESPRQSKPSKTGRKRLRFHSSTDGWRERKQRKEAKFNDLGRVEKMPREVEKDAADHGASYNREYPHEGLVMCKETIEYPALNEPLSSRDLKLDRYPLVRALLAPSATVKTSPIVVQHPASTAIGDDSPAVSSQQWWEWLDQAWEDLLDETG
jgi:hypothetical protein